MHIMEIELPDNYKLDKAETTRYLAAKMYEDGRLTLGQAAEMSNLSKIAFSEILSDYGVSLINYSYEEAINDSRKI
jgi:predicted HTH domain antitoxin